MAVKTIYDIFEILKDNITDFSINATDKNGTPVQVISAYNARKYMSKKYASRKYPVILGTSATITDARDDFEETFNMFMTNHRHGIDKQYQALFDYNYSPIENVDRYENEEGNNTRTTDGEKTTTHNLSDTTTYGRTETNSGTDTTTYGRVVSESGTDTTRKTGVDTFGKSGAIVNETQKAGFNAPNAYTNDSRSQESYNAYDESTTYGSSDATTFGHTDTNSGSDTLNHGHAVTLGGNDTTRTTGTVTDDDTTNETSENERSLHVHGNIGVTTNNQLIEAELEMRKISLAEMILDDFINTYTYYS